MEGRVDLGGYGICRLPVTSGQHKRMIVCSRPQGTIMQNLAGKE